MKRSYVIVDKLGLHARPATLIVSEASKFDNQINMIYEGRSIDAKSILGVMTLAVSANTEFTFEVNGENNEVVFDALEKVLNDYKLI